MAVEYYVVEDEDMIPRYSSMPYPTAKAAYQSKGKAAQYIVAVENGVERPLTTDELPDTRT